MTKFQVQYLGGVVLVLLFVTGVICVLSMLSPRPVPVQLDQSEQEREACLLMGKVIVYLDSDGDGYGIDFCAESGAKFTNLVAEGGDCDDTNKLAHSTADPELCDNADNDCDGIVDETLGVMSFGRDADGDTYGSSTDLLVACAQPAGYVQNRHDCDDAAPGVHPAASEVKNGTDDNCNAIIDEGYVPIAWYRDMDSDGYGNPSTEPQMSIKELPGYVTRGDDCNDGNSSINPRAPDPINEIDENCDGADGGFRGGGFFR